MHCRNVLLQTPLAGTFCYVYCGIAPHAFCVTTARCLAFRGDSVYAARLYGFLESKGWRDPEFDVLYSDALAAAGEANPAFRLVERLRYKQACFVRIKNYLT
jgi:hypothetical protein